MICFWEQFKGGIAEHYCADSIRKKEDLSWKEWGKRFNEYLSHLNRLFYPDAFILGGGASKKFDNFAEQLDVPVKVIPAQLLNQAGIAYAGLAGTDETVVIERDGIRYGFCAFAPNSGTCDVRNITRAKAIVSSLAESADIVIVSFHGGAEGSKHQHVTRKTETYYGENRGNVYQFAHAVVDAGADVVFGHGPHVTRAMELYKDRLICYSLGNFCTYGRFNVRGVNGVAPMVKLEVDDAGKFVRGQVTPIYQMKTHGPKIDPQKRAITLLRDLTKADFPETPLVIGEDGALSKKE